jgi:uncharacterized phage-associated protein
VAIEQSSSIGFSQHGPQFQHAKNQDWLISLDGRALANHVLDFCDAHERPITNLSLQKIVFFCHVWTLLDFDRPLVKQEFEAWEYGPVLQYVYRDFKQAGDSPISFRAKKIDPATGQAVVVGNEMPDELKIYLNKILGFYTRLSAGQLVNLSHVKSGPWDQVWNHEGKTNPGMRISNGAIKLFYSTAKATLSYR